MSTYFLWHNARFKLLSSHKWNNDFLNPEKEEHLLKQASQKAGVEAQSLLEIQKQLMLLMWKAWAVESCCLQATERKIAHSMTQGKDHICPSYLRTTELTFWLSIGLCLEGQKAHVAQRKESIRGQRDQFPHFPSFTRCNIYHKSGRKLSLESWELKSVNFTYLKWKLVILK